MTFLSSPSSAVAALAPPYAANKPTGPQSAAEVAVAPAAAAAVAVVVAMRESTAACNGTRNQRAQPRCMSGVGVTGICDHASGNIGMAPGVPSSLKSNKEIAGTFMITGTDTLSILAVTRSTPEAMTRRLNSGLSA